MFTDEDDPRFKSIVLKGKDQNTKKKSSGGKGCCG